MSDKKYPIGGYAPGNYYCTCCTCREIFVGDKRAVQCLRCATIDKEEFDALPEAQQQAVIMKNIQQMNKFWEERRNNKS